MGIPVCREMKLRKRSRAGFMRDEEQPVAETVNRPSIASLPEAGATFWGSGIKAGTAALKGSSSAKRGRNLSIFFY
jgi:hypothetical protein